MAQPPDYDKTTNFTQYATNNPQEPYPPALVDQEFDNIETTLDATLVNLELIQRDDGALQNDIVTQDAISDSVIIGVNPPTTWAPITDYTVQDSVFNDDIWYFSSGNFTSGATFNAANWTVINDFNSLVPTLSTLNSLTDVTLASEANGDMLQFNGILWVNRDVATIKTGLGLGTLADQNANAVAITGGNINGTIIGDSTTAAGSFTTMIANAVGIFSGAINNTNIGFTTPNTGKFTTLQGTSMNNTPIGASTAATGKFTTLEATSGINSTAIGLTVAAQAAFTGLQATNIDTTPIGVTTPSTGAFTTLIATTLDTTPIGSATPSTGAFSTLIATTLDTTPIGSATPSTGAFTTLSTSSTFSTSNADINGGNIDGTIIGASVAAAATFTTLTIAALDNTPIGAVTPSTGAFTTLIATTLDTTPIGSVTPSTGAFSTLIATTLDTTPIGSVTASTGAFTTLVATSLDTTPIGMTTPSTAEFTSLEAASLDSTPIGGITPSTGEFTILEATTFDSTPIGSITPSTGAFSTLIATTLDTTPIGSVTPSTGAFSTLIATTLDTTPVGSITPSTGVFTDLASTGTLSLTDTDGDTSIEIERTADDDTVFFKLAGTDFITMIGGTLNILPTNATFAHSGTGLFTFSSDGDILFSLGNSTDDYKFVSDTTHTAHSLNVNNLNSTLATLRTSEINSNIGSEIGVSLIGRVNVDNSTEGLLGTNTDSPLSIYTNGTSNKTSVFDNETKGLTQEYGVLVNPADTGFRDTGSVRILELAANGTNSVGIKGDDSMAVSNMHVLPTGLQQLNDTMAGTVAVTSGSATVTGTGTAFTSAIGVGDPILIDTVVNQVKTITSDTILTTVNDSGVTSSGLSIFRDEQDTIISIELRAIGTTTDAVQTTIGLIPVPTDSVMTVKGLVFTRKVSGAGSGTVGDGAGIELYSVFKNVSGTVTRIDAQDKVDKNSVNAWTADYNISGTDVTIQATGSASNNMDWEAKTFINIKT